MEVYLVGGAVRDRLLGRPVVERDWVVLGATPQQLLARGYRRVGKGFPVFLHPRTGDQYALPRGVSLEDDLARRDLSINAIAQAEDGRLVDPHGGLRDLELRVLRHVSSHFADDPLRVLRLARFMARYAGLGFRVAPATLDLCRDLADTGALDALVAERVWAELSAALGETEPWRFVETLRACGALARVFPEIDGLFGVPQPREHHPEVDTGTHALLVLRRACELSDEPAVRFSALLHDLGKGATPVEQWPRHQGHEQRSFALVRRLCLRLRAPNAYRELAELTARHHGQVHRALELRPGKLLELLRSCDALRRPRRFADLLLACEADFRGRPGYERQAYPETDYLREMREVVAQVDTSGLAALKAQARGERLRTRQLEAISAFKRGWNAPKSE